MNSLYQNLKQLHTLQNIVKTRDPMYFSHNTICPQNITPDTISIVMTSHERSKQVYFTLDTISTSNYKDVQVILVDDSQVDPIDSTRLHKYNMMIEFIQINRDKKCWSNPCINYNIGFEFVKGGKVIIQNSEVCHIGDVLSYVDEKTTDNIYYAFDVKASRNMDTNEVIYRKDRLDTAIYNEDLWDSWYQHYNHRNVQYHFLCALTKTTFDKIGGFSYDYAFGSGYDDNDLLLKINMQSIPTVNVCNDIYQIGGIHLFHGYNMPDRRAYVSEQNDTLFEKKKRYCAVYKQYIELSEHFDYNVLYTHYINLTSM
jgi:hypothetical protein